jgi:tetratricopeptide (TPR) repeat protein
MENKDSIQTNIDEALLNFKKAKYQISIDILENLEEKESNFLICWYLGHSYFRIYNYLSSIKYIKKSINLKGPDELNQSFLAEVMLQSNQYEEAIKLFEKVLNINEKNINALFNLGKIYSEIGKFKIAERYYNKIIKEEPNNFNAFYQLIKLDRKYLSNNLIKHIKNFKIEDNKNNPNNIYASLILAENNKNNKDYDNELHNLINGHQYFIENKKKASQQEFNYFTNLLPQFIKKIEGIDFKSKSKNQPIFIMGLPRSGTTMIENLICSGENKIIKGDETGVMGKVFFSKKIISNYDDTNLNVNFNFDKNGLQSLENFVLNQYKQGGIDTSKSSFTDKSLENFLYIKILSKIFPKAKFIYCKRNYVANLIGILKVFLPNLLWSHSLEKIITFMELYENNLNEILLEKKIALKIINLENFSENPLDNSKNLFNFLGIKWNKKIIDDNYKKTTIIKTVSNLQVRNKITKHDLSYLENYIPFLKKYGIKKLT